MSTMNTEQELRDAAGQAREAASDLFGKVKSKVSSLSEEIHERVSEWNFDEHSAAESLASNLRNGYVPHLFDDLVKDAVGFDPFNYDADNPATVVNQQENSLLTVIGNNDFCVSIEVIDSDEDNGELVCNHPQHRRYLSHVCGSLVEPIGVSKKNMYDNTWIYCTVYSAKFMFSKEHGDDPMELSNSRLEDPSVAKGLYALHQSKVNIDNANIGDFPADVARKFEHIYPRIVEPGLRGRLYDVRSEFYNLMSRHHSDRVIMLGDSIKTAVFQQFNGAAANVSRLYYGPRVFDLGYLLYASGVWEDIYRSREVLYHYKLSSSAASIVEKDELLDDAILAAGVISVLEEADSAIENAS